jgi:uncharacterized protein YcsI (UPF0317 family)
MVSSDSWHISVLPDKDHDHKELSVFRRKKCLLCSGSKRTDLPGYRIYRKGALVAQRGDICDLWRDDLVAFLLGCSS